MEREEGMEWSDESGSGVTRGRNSAVLSIGGLQSLDHHSPVVTEGKGLMRSSSN
jgi:hypothetical protein